MKPWDPWDPWAHRTHGDHGPGTRAPSRDKKPSPKTAILLILTYFMHLGYSKKDA